ncbi:MAG: glutathione S-transferase family protein [Hahellaceae bacterium]|nr:glutathione S-transferase family protein [Hahellaceae bacterium]
MSLVTLYQFPISHYCEKVRWALDFKGIPYERVNLVPLWHVPRLLMLSRQTQVPVIVMDGATVTGSWDILLAMEDRFPATPRLLPGRDSERRACSAIDAYCDRQLGPHVRRACYFHILQDSEATFTLLSEGQGLSGRFRLRASLPVVIRGMRQAMHVHRHGYLASIDAIRDALNYLDNYLGGRSYYQGNHFSATDMTVASMLAPLARPPSTIYAKPLLLDQGFHDLIALFNHHPMIDWTRRTYARYRNVQRVCPA